MECTLTSHEGAYLLGVNIKTIQRWDREGRLKAAGRTATGRRYYTEDQILAFRHQQPDSGRGLLLRQRPKPATGFEEPAVGVGTISGRRHELPPQKVFGLDGCCGHR